MVKKAIQAEHSLQGKARFHWSLAGAFAEAGVLTLNLLTIDFSGDAPASAKMGTLPIRIFMLPQTQTHPQMLSGNSAKQSQIFRHFQYTLKLKK